MQKKTSAAVLLYRRPRPDGEPEVLLVHPGGPYWAKKDLGAWSLPKGEYDAGDDPLEAAKRELKEETGLLIDGDYVGLQPLVQRSGKLIHAFAVEGDCDPQTLRSEVFAMEWPPKSGQQREFPEVDRAAWFTLTEARRRLLPGQVGFLDQLASLISARRIV